MEKKTNKAKFRNFQTFEKIGRIARLSPLINLAEIVSYYGNSIKYTLTRVFLQAEFISAMKTVQNPTVFMKTQK